MLLQDLYITETLEDHGWKMIDAVADLMNIDPKRAEQVVNTIQDFHPDFWKIVSILEKDDLSGLRRMFNQSFQNSKMVEPIVDEGMAWAKSGTKVVRKFRCAGGPRKGRVVSKPAQCFAPPDIKKRNKLKQTKARLGKKMSKKRKKTMRSNSASRRVQQLNKKR